MATAAVLLTASFPLSFPRDAPTPGMPSFARLDAADGGRLRLARFTSDPHSVGKRFFGESLLPLDWAKLAQGEPLTAGDRFCPSCRAEFNHDRSKQLLTLLNPGAANPAWDAWRGQAIPLTTWYVAASGKQSLHQGWLCPACRAEFDDEPTGLKAVRLPPGPLSALVNRVHCLGDWYRRAVGAPTALEEEELRSELARLQHFKREEQAEVQRSYREKRSTLEGQLTRLLKQAVVEGFYPVRLHLRQIFLPEEESLHWEGSCEKLEQRTARGSTYWETDSPGTLLVTSERILFDSRPHKLWEYRLPKLLGVDRQHWPARPNILLWLAGRQKPVGLQVADVQRSVKAGDQTRTITLDAGDLARLLQTLIGKRK